MIPAPDPPVSSTPWRDATFSALHTSPVRPRILLAEDDLEMRRIVAEALRKDGYDVLESVDGGRLLVRIATEFTQVGSPCSIDLIVSDIRMPVCTGIEILQGLRAAHWRIPVILMTAFGDRETRAQVEALGALLFDKPFEVDDLRTAVLNLLPRAMGPAAP